MTLPVTVLMTMHNAAGYLGPAIRSILAQTHREFELLIIDDGSTDESVTIARSFYDSRIRLVANERNQGQTACLNQGLALARGEFIARQDADDLSLPRRLELQLAVFTRDPQIVLLGTQGWIMNAAGRVCGGFNLPLRAESIRWSRLFENPFIHTAVMFRLEVVRSLGGYDPSFQICQDYELWMRVLRAGRGLNLRDRLVAYRVHPGSLSRIGEETVRVEVRRVLEAEESLSPQERELLCRARRILDPAECAPLLALRQRLLEGRNPGRAGSIHLAKMGSCLVRRAPVRGGLLMAQAALMSPRLAMESLAGRLSAPAL